MDCAKWVNGWGRAKIGFMKLKLIVVLEKKVLLPVKGWDQNLV